MACYNPMHMICRDFSSCNRNLIDRAKQLNWKINEDTYQGYRFVAKSARGVKVEDVYTCPGDELIEVPCGKCIGCRLDYSKDWANRCDLEARKYKYNYFVTLTYDDDHVTVGSEGNYTLIKSEISDFIKKLRKKFKRTFDFDGIKFYGCGEYGDQTWRPHYHIILFNCPIPDLSPDFFDEKGQVSHHVDGFGHAYMFSKLVQSCWNKGHILIADCNWDTSAYVSRYVLKKQKGEGADLYKALGIIPPYIAMSNHPGIAKDYFDSNADKLVDFPSIIMARDRKKPLISPIPRYYKKLIKRDHPERYDDYVEHAKELIGCSRSLLAGKQLINDNRISREDMINKRNKIIRDFKV